MTDTNTHKREEIQVLNSIMEKTKRHKAIHHSKQVIYVIVEIICYLLFLFTLIGALLLPDFLELKLEAVEDEIGFYILDVAERKIWSTLLRIALVLSSLAPLVTGILLRRLRIKNRILNQVFKLASERVLKLNG